MQTWVKWLIQVMIVFVHDVRFQMSNILKHVYVWTHGTLAFRLPWCMITPYFASVPTDGTILALYFTEWHDVWVGVLVEVDRLARQQTFLSIAATTTRLVRFSRIKTQFADKRKRIAVATETLVTET